MKNLTGHVRLVSPIKGKSYLALVKIYTGNRQWGLSKKVFRTATQADNYALRWRQRIIRLYKPEGQLS